MVHHHFCNKKSSRTVSTNTKIYRNHLSLYFNEKIDQKYLDKDEITKEILDREDIIGRNDKFKIDLDNSFPEYLIKNLNNFKIG